MDQEKYKFNVDFQIPIEMPLYEKIVKGDVVPLLEAFRHRKEILLNKIRIGGTQEEFRRWKACLDALESACTFLERYNK